MANAHDHFLNSSLYDLASLSLGQLMSRSQKRAFVPGGDPAAAAGPPGGMPPGGMPPGGDPSAGQGGMPPAAPPGGADPLQQIMQDIQTLKQQQQMGGAGAGQGSGAALKPKIDVNVEIMQIKNMLAKIVDHLGIPIPAQDMAATSDKLMTMAQGGNPASGAQVGGGAGGAGAIPPIDPMQGSGVPGQGKQASVRLSSIDFSGNISRVQAIARIRQHSQAA